MREGKRRSKKTKETLGARVDLKTYRFFRNLSYGFFNGNVSECLRYFLGLILDGGIEIVDADDELCEAIGEILEKQRRKRK